MGARMLSYVTDHALLFFSKTDGTAKRRGNHPAASKSPAKGEQ